MAAAALTTAYSLAQSDTARNLVSGATNTISNLLGGTSDTCAGLPSDDQLAHIIASANRNEDPMRRLRERFGRSSEAKAYGELTTAIYRAPISTVGAWLRYDCKSAGPIRQSMKADVQTLWAKYGSSYGAAASSAAAPQYFGAPASVPPLQGDLTYGSGSGWTGGISFGGDTPQAAPVWMKIALGALILLAVWAVATGRAGNTGGGL